jgi:HPt (histidine-containing phosphotransfer) domain-containing protein
MHDQPNHSNTPRQHAAPPASLPGFEVGHTVERMLGQPELWWQAVGLFVAHFADWETEWQASQCDPASERKCVHALRSAAANIGAHHLSCVAGVLEKLLARQLAGDHSRPISPSIRCYLQDNFRQLWRTARDAHATGQQDNAKH